MTRFGDFSKFLSTNFPLKEAQIFSDHFGFLKTVDFEVITAVATFWQLLKIFGLLFIPTSGHSVSLLCILSNTSREERNDILKTF